MRSTEYFSARDSIFSSLAEMHNERELNMGMKCVKYMLFIANFMFILVGFLLMSIGSTIKTIYSDFDEFIVYEYYTASNMAFAIGIIIFLVALFGCIGAVKESVCLINMYGLLLTCILILEITVSIIAYSMRYSIESTVRENMIKYMSKYKENQFTWDATQYNLQCCGVDGPDDWKKFNSNSTKGNSTDFQLPSSCCYDENCNKPQNIYSEGCLTIITYIVSQSALLLGAGATCVAFIQLLGVIFAHLLARSIRRLKTQREVARNELRQHIYEQLANAGNGEKVTPVLYTPTSSEA